jgi:hypothetical protein
VSLHTLVTWQCDYADHFLESFSAIVNQNGTEIPLTGLAVSFHAKQDLNVSESLDKILRCATLESLQLLFTDMWSGDCIRPPHSLKSFSYHQALLNPMNSILVIEDNPPDYTFQGSVTGCIWLEQLGVQVESWLLMLGVWNESSNIRKNGLFIWVGFPTQTACEY